MALGIRLGRNSLRAIAAVVAGFAWAGTAQGDVFNPPPTGFNEIEKLGVVTIVRGYEAEPGRTCEPMHPRPAWCRLVSVGVEWSPPDLPIFVALIRRKTGFALEFSSLLHDRKVAALCWSSRALTAAEVSSSDKLLRVMEAGFGRWAESCAVTRALGADATRSTFGGARRDIGRAYVILHRKWQLAASDSETGLGSFFPAKVSQPLLDAVAIACDGPRDRLTLRPDGTIDWKNDRNVPRGADGSLPFDECVNMQIRYFPGYPTQS